MLRPEHPVATPISEPALRALAQPSARYLLNLDHDLVNDRAGAGALGKVKVPEETNGLNEASRVRRKEPSIYEVSDFAASSVVDALGNLGIQLGAGQRDRHDGRAPVTAPDESHPQAGRRGGGVWFQRGLAPDVPLPVDQRIVASPEI